MLQFYSTLVITGQHTLCITGSTLPMPDQKEVDLFYSYYKTIHVPDLPWGRMALCLQKTWY